MDQRSAIRCPESWSDIAPRVELDLLLGALVDDEVRLLVRIAAYIVRNRRLARAVVPEVEDILICAAFDLLGGT
ncbi:MAG: hypothetical protein ACRELB_21685 [Polyangiaceae bacterium]